MANGGQPFLLNFSLHLEHFPGQTAIAVLPTATWAGSTDKTWTALTSELGIPSAPALDERIEINAAGTPALGGRVVDVAPWRPAVLVDQPSPGTGFLAIEGRGERVEVSAWTYRYGTEGTAAGDATDLVGNTGSLIARSEC
jgi:hypothetical protein